MGALTGDEREFIDAAARHASELSWRLWAEVDQLPLEIGDDEGALWVALRSAHRSLERAADDLRFALEVDAGIPGRRGRAPR